VGDHQYGVRVLELTGDLAAEDTGSLQHSDLILATPEKWDAVSRRDSRQLIHAIHLFMIDEVHLLSDEDRDVLSGF
jgi:replicative superfamily II helicase